LPEMNPKRDLRGIIASLHTPFFDNGRLDQGSVGRLVRHTAESGCIGILIAAVAGEAGSLTSNERKCLVDTAIEAGAGRLKTVVGVSAADLPTSRTLAEHARLAGADMILWQPPNGLSDHELEQGLKALADAGPGQVMLQDLAWQGSGFEPGLIVRLAEKVPALSAVKVEVANPGRKFTALQSALGDRLHLSGGWAAMQMLDGLARGIDAFIPSGLLPTYSKIFALWQQGDSAAATALFERSLPVLAFSNQHIDISIRFWKQLRQHQGLFTSATCRPPIPPLDAVEQQQADRLLRSAVDLGT
jgi:dihydrodipicolinate synthase/N-acetylneuraminate lyase